VTLMEEITLSRPDDWHVHLRDGAMLRMALPWTVRTFGRAIVMPNLDPPVTSAAQAAAYRDRIRRVLPDGSRFETLMTCFLTEEADPEDVAQGFAEGVFTATAKSTNASQLERPPSVEPAYLNDTTGRYACLSIGSELWL